MWKWRRSARRRTPDEAAIASFVGVEGRRLADHRARRERAEIAAVQAVSDGRVHEEQIAVRKATAAPPDRQIPPQMAIILVRANTIENCPNCNRIIYVPEAVSPASPPAP